ncbi:uncharacterized protein LOC143290131 [Babylonia areolata]|uniref:uncharacterized protein LOC143290131 n=1 Tax=Babylonia areolata TaxID=304850 RepID=UPI003FD26BC7
MIVVLMVALCVTGSRGLSILPRDPYYPYYSCPPDNYPVKQFRDLTSSVSPQEIPSAELADKDVSSAPEEIRQFVKNNIKDAIAIKSSVDIVRPYVRRCCPRPSYNCTSVDIPLKNVWYRGVFCFIVFPAGKEQLYYKKCTCVTCLRHDYCPVVGRCVETTCRSVTIVAYCPRLYPSPFVKLSMSIPQRCVCLPRCPSYSPYPPYPIPYNNPPPIRHQGSQMLENDDE